MAHLNAHGDRCFNVELNVDASVEVEQPINGGKITGVSSVTIFFPGLFKYLELGEFMNEDGETAANVLFDLYGDVLIKMVKENGRNY